jgi:hypothetical protein
MVAAAIQPWPSCELESHQGISIAQSAEFDLHDPQDQDPGPASSARFSNPGLASWDTLV